MKKWYLFALFLLTVNMVSSQWYYSTLMTPTNAVVFMNESTGVVSTGFTLARTTDGGISWTNVCNAAMDSIFISISFPSEMVGFAVGLGGNIVKTIDGGSTWQHLTTGSGKNLRSAFFTSENNGYIAGDDHTLFRTSDGGLTWQTLTSPVEMAWSMHFTSDTFGILTGNTRSIFRTQDGGVNWLEIAFPSPNKYLSVHFPDESTAYACGMIDALTPCMIKSTDGGMKWTEVPVTTGKGLMTVHFLTSTLGYAAGTGGTVIRTTDGGVTWALQQTPNPGTINGLWFTGTQKGYAAGTALLRTDNGGGVSAVFDPVLPLPVKIYPNPATSYIMIDLPETTADHEITLVNSEGRVVKRARVAQFPEKMDISGLAGGSYRIFISDGKTSHAGSFIILFPR